jgi:hypothetical protein
MHAASSLLRVLSLASAVMHSVSATCDALSGTWTGFVGSQPLFDSYELKLRGAFFPQGSFTSVYIGGTVPTWTIGFGQLSADNTTVSLTFDNGVALTGTVSDDCTTMTWENGSSWSKSTAVPKTVHLLFLTHLDVGYHITADTGTGFVNHILNVYMSTYFPRALALADAMRALNRTERFIYTTHPWLLHLYLHCPANFTLSNITLQCPSQGDVMAMRAAVARGDVVIHASPFNIDFAGAHSQDMLDAMFALPKQLAEELVVPAPLVASLRDVPGAPRSLIPALARAGIPVLSIGLNPWAPNPRLPVPCVWREPSTNASVVLLQTDQGVGYPVNVGSDPLNPGGLSAHSCMSHPASSHVLCWAFRDDNSGPPRSVTEILNDFDIARWQWPGANVVASTFDAWWAEFEDIVPLLPVAEQEAGDTWMNGYSSDPPKMAFYRVASREYSTCLAAGLCDPVNDARISQFLFFLMKLPEHTWGLPTIYDDENYTNEQFHAARASGAATYINSEMSWSEQRAFGTQYAMAALADHPLAAQIEAALTALTPVLPNVSSGYSPVPSPQGPFSVSLDHNTSASVSIGFDPATGAIGSLISAAGQTLADAAHPMARLIYQTVNDTDLDEQQITVDGQPCCCCFGWGNMQQAANPISSRTAASLVSLWASQPGPTYTAPATFLARLSFPAFLNQQYGAPGDIWMNYTVDTDGSVSIQASFFNKTATRLGEAIYLDFSTIPVADGSAWLADILGHWTDPLDVVVRGSQRQFGVRDGVAYLSPSTGAGVAVASLDALVFSPWTACNVTSTLIVPFYPLVGPVEGFSAVLFSNIFNTNVAMYSTEEAYTWRFAVQTVQASESRAKDVKAAKKKGA